MTQVLVGRLEIFILLAAAAVLLELDVQAETLDILRRKAAMAELMMAVLVALVVIFIPMVAMEKQTVQQMNLAALAET
jgi:hypothetical protein